MNIPPSFKQATTLKEALENAGRLWWVEERVNAIDEETAKDEAFLRGARQGVWEQVDRWAQRSPEVARFNTQQAAINLFNQLLADKFELLAVDEQPEPDEDDEDQDE